MTVGGSNPEPLHLESNDLPQGLKIRENISIQGLKNISHSAKKKSTGYLTRFETNRSVQSQKEVRSLKFGI